MSSESVMTASIATTAGEEVHAEDSTHRLGHQKRVYQSRTDADAAPTMTPDGEIPFEDDEALLEEALAEETAANDHEGDEAF